MLGGMMDFSSREAMRGIDGWIRVEMDPGQFEPAPWVKPGPERGPRGGVILLYPAEGLTPLEDQNA